MGFGLNEDTTLSSVLDVELVTLLEGELTLLFSLSDEISLRETSKGELRIESAFFLFSLLIGFILPSINAGAVVSVWFVWNVWVVCR